MVEKYNEESIRSLEWREHIRLRPGMYIGKLGDGSAHDDGIYVLVKEIIDNSIDEFIMEAGTTIDISIKENKVKIRDYGRGIPLGKVVECVASMNTGAKYDSSVFKKTVGLNGVGTKAVNALSSFFKVQSIREKKTKIAIFEKGDLLNEHEEKCQYESGTIVSFIPDEEIFGRYTFMNEYVENLIWNYVFLNRGLTINFNGQVYRSQNGLKDLLERQISGKIVYPPIHIGEKDFEFAITHADHQYGEEYYSFVNGQHTTQGGTHQAAFREALIKTIREFYKKDFDPSDIKSSVIAAISIRVVEPVFESQTKTKLGSQYMEPKGQSIKNYIGDIVKKHLDDYLHIHSDVAEALLNKIHESEKERKEIANIKKLSKDRAKKTSLHNKKLRDCRIHFDSNDDQRFNTTLFITEGDSASGSITKARDVQTQAVFSLKGKPVNCYGLSKKVVYENEELNLLQSALNIEEGLENLRYNNVVIATDADVDGMHIRLLLLTYFLQFYPDLVKNGHVYILQTPLFRVRNKKSTQYCYSEDEKNNAVTQLGPKPEITRFKGLGEISPDEFKQFISSSMRLEPVVLMRNEPVEKLLSYFMGDNTRERQLFIIDNLRIEKDTVEENLVTT
ncbi:MAG: DNA topoisomerase IV subunit B [Bacteroidota bacterium]